MHHTLPQIEIPDSLERALHERAEAEQKSLDVVILDALARGLGVDAEKPVKKRDLSAIAGTWVFDSETEAVLEEQGRIDPEMWQ